MPNLYPELPTPSEMPANVETNSAQISISLELAEKMLIKFDGSKSKLHEFIDNCDKAVSLVKPEYKNILFAIIETKITDNARALIRNRTFNDWITLKNHLLDAYSEKRTISQWQLELNSCKQNTNENVMSYANKVENCYIKLINSLDQNLSREAREACVNLLKNQALNVFVTGLQNNLSIIVKSLKPESLEDAIAFALNEEQEQKSRLEIQKYQNVHNNIAKLCSFCNKSGHSSFNCHFNKNNSHRQHNVRHIQNSNPQRPNNSSFQTNSKFSSSKPIQNKVCSYCKNIGHLIGECRKREYNNRMRNNNLSKTHYPGPSNSQTHNCNSLNSQVPRQSAGMRLAQTFQVEQNTQGSSNRL
ncbi:GATA zinc finger domain-containing protein 14-like [Agrilus planipennis]|uniref:GATA zinc finger domain-containing protein 14-like n=1 Tax=Agrilus planipennis TaxID=224129 RepID=A0A7F5QXG0_AGRPL|nr:GATA zinc finger domain-containing protein 14-like [Agrilus planipennis]